MYIRKTATTYTLEESMNLFCETMDLDKPLCRLAETIEWDFVEDLYAEKFKSGGKRAIWSRTAFGCVLLKTMTRLPAEKLLTEIQNNASFQYFLGFPAFQHQIQISASSIQRFSRRFSVQDLQQIVMHQMERETENTSRSRTSELDSPDSQSTSSVRIAQSKTDLLDQFLCLSRCQAGIPIEQSLYTLQTSFHPSPAQIVPRTASQTKTDVFCMNGYEQQALDI